jgi:ATP-dependent helicase HrpB
MSLPIDAVLTELVAAVRARGAVVLHAPTGAGKTTRVPLALLDTIAGRIVMLEPRRVAARAAAARMAATLGEPVGQTVGYQVRFDRRATDKTRVLVVTEGVLLQQLVADPFLDGVGCVILDEVHERGLDADLALALVARVRADARPDLAVVAMSATADTDRLAAFLGAAVVRSEGRSFPVDVSYLPRPDDRELAVSVAEHAAAMAARTDGDVLVFLPGVGEIEAVRRRLTGVDVVPLHGRLTPAEQDRALQPGDRQRVVLATNVAETSVTLPGVTAVVDAGLVRLSRHDPRRGLDRLVLEPTSRASADQRTGRAGRVRPGVALRLWTELSHNRRPAHDEPEVARVDLCRVVLQVLTFGDDPAQLAWLDAPPPHALAAAHDLLARLGAVDRGRLTDVGRRLGQLPTHPRLGRLLEVGHGLGRLDDAALAAALLEERLPLTRSAPPVPTDSDLDDLLEAVRGARTTWRPRFPGALDQLRAAATNLADRARRVLGPAPRAPRGDLSEALVAAWPDRVAARRADGRLTLANGRGARLAPDCGVLHAPLLVALDVQDTDDVDAIIHLAAAVDPACLPVTDHAVATFDLATDRVLTAVERRYGDLVLDRRLGAQVPAEVLTAALIEGARRAPLPPWPDDPDTTRLLGRMRFVQRERPQADLPPVDDDALFEVAVTLAPGRRSLAELRAGPWRDALLDRLTWAQRTELDRLAPESLEVPSGSHIRLDYPADGPPVLAVRIQELFGARATPTVAGRPVLLHLLAPNHRPQQVTDDLAGFWQRTWPEVRKDLRARYPRHSWPDDPTTAPPQRRPARPPIK